MFPPKQRERFVLNNQFRYFHIRLVSVEMDQAKPGLMLRKLRSIEDKWVVVENTKFVIDGCQ